MKGRIGQWLSRIADRFAFSRHSRASGNPASLLSSHSAMTARKSLDSRLRGNDGLGGRWFRRLTVVVALIAAYPTFVFATVYVHWFAADLPGGRNGPADAYRHALASATVAYTATPRWVDWVTVVMERNGAGNDSRAMDAHNNRIGAAIGARAENWGAMQAQVLDAVRTGGIGASDADTITWLPPERWQNRWY